MSAFDVVWVMGENPKSYASLCAVGHRLGERVEALWIGSSEAAEELQNLGFNTIHRVPQLQNELFENCAAAAIEHVITQKPDIILFSTSKRMRLMAAHFAAALKTRAVNDATQVWIEDDSLFVEHMVYGGSAFSTECLQAKTAVLLLSDSLLLNEPLNEIENKESRINELPVNGLNEAIKLVERHPRTVETVNLAAAKRVVSVGRGVGDKSDLQMIDRLVHALEAEMGCTRPIAEGVGWMARARYIGVSGAMLKPDLFVAIGVSGQIQHMVGANRAKTIIAINKDKNAPVFKQADYGIIGDLYDVVPQLIEALGR